MVLPVLIHDGEAFDAFRGRAGFGNINHTCVEIALFAGEALVDFVRHQVADAAPVAAVRVVFLARDLLFAERVPQPEADAHMVGTHGGDGAGDQRLRVDLPPVGVAGDRVAVGDLLDERVAVDGAEQARTLEIVGDDGAHLRTRRFTGAFAGEGGDGDGHRLDVAFGNVDFQLRAGGSREQQSGGKGKQKALAHGWTSRGNSMHEGWRGRDKISSGISRMGEDKRL